MLGPGVEENTAETAAKQGRQAGGGGRQMGRSGLHWGEASPTRAECRDRQGWCAQAEDFLLGACEQLGAKAVSPCAVAMAFGF